MIRVLSFLVKDYSFQTPCGEKCLILVIIPFLIQHLMTLASELYDESDFIRIYDAFLEYVKN